MDGANAKDQSARWVANELHDGLMQWIFAAKLKVESLRSESVDGSGLEDLMGILQVAHAEGRALIRHLEDSQKNASSNPFSLLSDLVENLGLLETQDFQVRLDRSWFIEAAKFADTGCNCTPELAWGILRIGQQAVFNVFKHSKQAEVLVRLQVIEPAALELVIEANQKPDHDAKSSTSDESSGFGIPSMKHRASQLGGKLDLDIRTEFSQVKLTVNLR